MKKHKIKELKDFRKKLNAYKLNKSYKDMVKHSEDENGHLHIVRECLSYSTETSYDEEGNIIDYFNQYHTNNFQSISLETLFDIERADYIIYKYSQTLQQQTEEQTYLFLNAINILIKQGLITWDQFLNAIVKVKINQNPITNLEQYKILKRELDNIKK